MKTLIRYPLAACIALLLSPFFLPAANAQTNADVGVTKTGPARANAGSDVTYTIEVTNTGPSTASTVTLSDTLPTGMTFVSLSYSDTWSCSTPAPGNSGTVNCSNPALFSGSDDFFTLVLHIDSNATAATTFANTATVSSATQDPNGANNSSTAETTVPGSDLGVFKTTGSDTASAGSNVTYTIEVTNVGPDPAMPATLTDDLPNGMTFVSITAPPGWSCSTPSPGTNGTVTCSNSNFAVGGDDFFTLVTNIPSETAPGTVFVNTASVTTTPSSLDPFDENNTSSAGTTVGGGSSADLGVTKTANSPNATAGSDATFTIEVRNSGPDAAANATLTDTLPGDMTFVSLSSPPGWTCSVPGAGSGGTVSCSNPSVPVNSTSVFTLVAHIPSGNATGTTYENVATIASASDENSENDQSVAQVAVSATPGLTTSASADIAIGGSISDSATLSGAFFPTGSIVFSAYGPDDTTCANQPAFTSSVEVTANSTYNSGPFTPTKAGTYRFVARYSGDQNNFPVTTACDDPNESVVVAKASPSLTTQASSSTTVGSPITDAATLASGFNPTGTVVFTLFGPDNTGCSGTPIFTSTKTVNGNGNYSSDPFTPTAPGTYRWVATYSGDANNNGALSACNAANESVLVTKASPALTTQASPAITVGSSISDTATISGGTGPTGTITFTLFGPDNTGCSGTPIFTSTKTVNGNGNYPSDSFTPTAPGTYRWVASYGGDNNNNAALSACNAPNESVVVSKASPTLSTQASPATIVGSPISDTATVSGGSSPTGTITFTLFGPDNTGCSGTPIFTSTKTVNGNGNYPSDPFTPTAPGTYRWVASYSGDGNNNATLSACNAANESVLVSKATPTMSTQASPATSVGAPITDSATVSGAFNPTGTITFTLFGPDNATCGGSAIFTSTVTVNGNATYTSAPFAPTAPGTYRWVASYSGDANNNAVLSACNAPNESVVVSKTTAALSTQASPATSVGVPITDTATISGAFNPTGTITFTLFGPDNATCGGAAIFTSTVTVNGNGNYTSGSYTVVAAGTYRWVATYSGDANNNGVISPCNAPNETVGVGKTSPTLTTTASPSINLGNGTISDTATLTNGVNPTGTITFNLFGPNNSNCTGTPVFTSTKTVSGNGTYASDAFTPTAVGTYNWVAVYSGDGNNNSVANVCGDPNESVTVNTPPTVQWSAATYSANENAGSVTLTVTRTGNTAATAMVHYATSDGTAKAGSDYAAASGDLTFAPGETSKNVPVTILDDTSSEGNETFNAVLTAISGAAVGSPQTATITLVDNEAAPTPTPSPTPTATPTTTPSPTPSATPTASATPTPTPTPAATPAQALNISTRLRVETGDKVMIGGFIITGNASKAVVLRGIGPSLVSANIPADEVLADPVLELRGSNGSLIVQNDNWKDSPQRAQIEGTPYEPSSDLESVIVATLQPGAYTAILTGKNQSTGVGVVEVYDNDQAASSTLANLSTRGFVQTEDNVMIGGFILGNNPMNTRIAVRGLGPSLDQFGVPDVLADPTIELHNENGTLMLANDNWKDDSASAAQLTANGLAPQNDLESGIFASLPPGQFTAILAGKDGTIGIGIIEVYNLK